MTQEKLMSLVRHIMSIGAGLLVSYGIGNDVLFADIAGMVLALISFVWSIKEQTYTVGKIEAFVRQALTFVGGFLTNKAWLTPDKIELWVSAVVAILPVILGNLDKNWGDPKPVE